jgi:hypothetical protein
VTFEYVVLTQENIELFRRQLERQERVYVHFELICRNGPLFIRVSNLGVSNFLVDAIHVRTQDIDEFHYSTADVVESGKTALIDLPREVCAGRPLTVDLEITLERPGLESRTPRQVRHRRYVQVGLAAHLPLIKLWYRNEEAAEVICATGKN